MLWGPCKNPKDGERRNTYQKYSYINPPNALKTVINLSGGQKLQLLNVLTKQCLVSTNTWHYMRDNISKNIMVIYHWD